MNEKKNGYDIRSAASIEAYARGLRNLTFREICERDSEGTDGEANQYTLKHGNKGKLGQLIEERYFHYECNNKAKPDFEEAGVELKVTPYKEDKKGRKSAKERLVITMVDYFEVPKETFESSHMWQKARLILLVYYLYRKEISDPLDYKIHFTKLFSPSAEDTQIIKQDFETIQAKIRAGKAHELSDRDTLYLAATTKAATSKDRKSQPYSNELAKPRAFTFKSSYMTYVLNKYVVGTEDECESIFGGVFEGTFENSIMNRLGSYVGMSVSDLCDRFEVSSKAKSLGAMLAYRMLGVRSNSAEEFVKANIAVKTIRIEANGRIKENMSFPAIRFTELVEEEWDDSTFGNYLRETRFLFIVFKSDSCGVYTFRGGQFWSIPHDDLEIEVKTVWEKTKSLVQNGLDIRIENGKFRSNFPKQKENRVSHVRPHAQDSSDTCALPDGRRFPKQCFWLNNSYILSQLRDDLKDD